MEMGAWADWVNVAATAVLAIIAGVWGFWSYRKQRDPEMKFVLTNYYKDEAGMPKDYQILALNNSTSNYVVLKNEVPGATGLYKSMYCKSPFYADAVIKPQENVSLCDLDKRLWKGLKVYEAPSNYFEQLIIKIKDKKYHSQVLENAENSKTDKKVTKQEEFELIKSLDYTSWYVADTINKRYYTLSLLAANPNRKRKDDKLRLKVKKRRRPLSVKRVMEIKLNCENKNTKAFYQTKYGQYKD
ncbi:hypothetical protein [Latilactobacillus sakei]|uniref:hypothetical protein n=1 Tax=Latilactobacillus sakei TaxID=1599 RepID=UPI000DC64477|nr:hypothetical protein [Latilactobacillus sakei]SPS07499.1 hypothetical protein LAS9624_01754 [Latilactobacillus sakei]